MKTAKKILDWIWLIVKIIFAIVLVIVGIKLILWLVLPIFPLWFISSPFGSFDFNPIATLIGAVITGGITWYAVDKTARFNRDNKLNEIKYIHYVENLHEFEKLIKQINRLTFYFEKNSTCSVNKNLDKSVLCCEPELRQVDKLYKHLSKVNPVFKQKTEGFDELFRSFREIYNYLKTQISEHIYYLEKNKEEFKKGYIKNLDNERVSYNGEEFLKAYKDYSNKDYNVLEMIEALDKIKDMIEDEFVMDDK